ncbi:ABC-type glycerol-3-phosphate transport system permease component [Naumannella cuiyingiana]|uniref:ABC-type glycerol-3-phosphate transport system permease component n=1 Tax=Naumannella cuiyingiana TaxID=1347891 RepID=A0A7Z0D9C3_9ACTN|nr:carbohydrate ABC transporter permease [Naumannella cuiyingiana]NYI71068.1 ABC-type glycerol-3-phosphate transport system permease component [Naumannella cuiyingiana]
MSTETIARPTDSGPKRPPIRRRHRRPAVSDRARFRPFHLFFYLLMGAGAFSAVAAFAWVINVSLKTNVEFITSPPFSLTRSWEFENYRQAWNAGGVAMFFGNSVLVAVTATVLGVFFSVLAAYPLARVRFPGSGIVLSVFILGLMVPWMVTFIPLYLTLRDIGLLDTQLGLILVYATYNLPFNIFVMVGFMRTLPVQLEEAAAIDGAGPARTFFGIILPLLGPGVASITIISFLNNWNEFFYALVLIRTKENMTLPVGLWQLSQAATYSSNWVTLFAAIMITVVPVLVVFALLQRRIAEGLTAGAIKG